MSADLTSLLTRHTIECTGPGEVTCRGCRDRGWMSWAAYHVHVAAMLMNSGWLAEHDREVAAAAVEAAATEFAEGAWSDAFSAGHVEDDISAVLATYAFFKARAQAIREGRA